jgi:hypothetical protein
MYQNTSAEFRPELYAVVEEARAIENKFIAEYIFPEFGVKTRTGDYKKIRRGKGQQLTNLAGDGTKDPLARAPGTAYPEITRTTEKAGWVTVDRGLKTAIDDVTAQDESRFFDQEVADAKWLMRVIRIYREVRVAQKVYNEDTWGKIASDIAFTAANRETLDFAELLKEAKRRVDLRQEDCDTLVVSRNLWDLITGSKKLKEYFFGTAGGSADIDETMIAKKFRLRQILIGNASFDTTKQGKTSTDGNLQWCWGDKYFWVGSVQGGPPENGGAGRTFILEDLTNGGQLYVPESWRDDDKRSNILRVRQDSDENVVNENCGLLVQVNDLA